ncbi:hypothetical protein NFI96_020419, partial [Prochilodus magdalenae]
SLDCGSHPCDRSAGALKGGVHVKDATYWKEIHAAMALTNLAQGEKDMGTTETTSCIIQKSSHIAEIKTLQKGGAAVEWHEGPREDGRQAELLDQSQGPDGQQRKTSQERAAVVKPCGPATGWPPERGSRYPRNVIG